MWWRKPGDTEPELSRYERNEVFLNKLATSPTIIEFAIGKSSIGPFAGAVTCPTGNLRLLDTQMFNLLFLKKKFVSLTGVR
jgi:hypothetical protein